MNLEKFIKIAANVILLDAKYDIAARMLVRYMDAQYLVENKENLKSEIIEAAQDKRFVPREVLLGRTYHILNRTMAAFVDTRVNYDAPKDDISIF